jgi:hypothetical protein
MKGKNEVEHPVFGEPVVILWHRGISLSIESNRRGFDVLKWRKKRELGL